MSKAWSEMTHPEREEYNRQQEGQTNAAPQADLKGSEAPLTPLVGRAASSHRPDAKPAGAAPESCPDFRTIELKLAERDAQINELNNVLRAAGWGQGEINSAAEMLAERDALLRDCDNALHRCQNVGEPPSHVSLLRCELLELRQRIERLK